MRWTTTLPLCLLLFALLLQCQRENRTGTIERPVTYEPAAIPYPALSDYAFFRGEMKALQPNDGVLPYELITPLFTDYAHKARFVWMPDSVQATVDERGVIQFPEHTVLIKNFYYPADFRQPAQNWDMVETRLLVKRQEAWEAYTYLWDESQSEAKLHRIGDIRSVSWVDEQGQSHNVEYIVPNQNQCKSCHNKNNHLEPIGPKVRNLNRQVTYVDGTASQIQHWQERGFLPPGDYAARHPALASWDDSASGSLQERAVAYLDINCGHWHRPEGSAHTTGLYLTVDYRKVLHRLGVCKTPVAAGKGSGNRQFGIHPGRPDESILVYRMESDDPGIMMPELGRVIEHREGIALIREWVESLEGDCQQKKS